MHSFLWNDCAYDEDVFLLRTDGNTYTFHNLDDIYYIVWAIRMRERLAARRKRYRFEEAFVRCELVRNVTATSSQTQPAVNMCATWRPGWTAGNGSQSHCQRHLPRRHLPPITAGKLTKASSLHRTVIATSSRPPGLISVLAFFVPRFCRQ